MSRLFLNDKTREFVITVWRGESNQVCKEVNKGSNQVEDHNTGLRHSDTNLDTDHDTFAEDHDTGLSYHDTNHDTKRVPLTNKKKDIVTSVAYQEQGGEYWKEPVLSIIQKI